MVMYVSGALGCTEPNKEYLAWPDGPRLKKAERASLDDVVLILRSRWPSADASEARETVARLLVVGHLRRVGGAAERSSGRSERRWPPTALVCHHGGAGETSLRMGRNPIPVCARYVKSTSRTRTDMPGRVRRTMVMSAP